MGLGTPTLAAAALIGVVMAAVLLRAALRSDGNTARRVKVSRRARLLVAPEAKVRPTGAEGVEVGARELRRSRRLAERESRLVESDDRRRLQYSETTLATPRGRRGRKVRLSLTVVEEVRGLGEGWSDALEIVPPRPIEPPVLTARGPLLAPSAEAEAIFGRDLVVELPDEFVARPGLSMVTAVDVVTAVTEPGMRTSQPPLMASASISERRLGTLEGVTETGSDYVDGPLLAATPSISEVSGSATVPIVTANEPLTISLFAGPRIDLRELIRKEPRALGPASVPSAPPMTSIPTVHDATGSASNPDTTSPNATLDEGETDVSLKNLRPELRPDENLDRVTDQSAIVTPTYVPETANTPTPEGTQFVPQSRREARRARRVLRAVRIVELDMASEVQVAPEPSVAEIAMSVSPTSENLPASTRSQEVEPWGDLWDTISQNDPPTIVKTPTEGGMVSPFATPATSLRVGVGVNGGENRFQGLDTPDTTSHAADSARHTGEESEPGAALEPAVAPHDEEHRVESSLKHDDPAIAKLAAALGGPHEQSRGGARRHARRRGRAARNIEREASTARKEELARSKDHKSRGIRSESSASKHQAPEMSSVESIPAVGISTVEGLEFPTPLAGMVQSDGRAEDAKTPKAKTRRAGAAPGSASQDEQPGKSEQENSESKPSDRARALSMWRARRTERAYRRKARRLGIEFPEATPAMPGRQAQLTTKHSTSRWQLPAGITIGPDRDVDHEALDLPEPVPPRS